MRSTVPPSEPTDQGCADLVALLGRIRRIAFDRHPLSWAGWLREARRAQTTMSCEVVEIIDLLEGGNVNRTSAWWFLIAFTVIAVLTIIEGINDGFTFLNWVVIAVSVVFALQAVWTLAGDRSSQA
jgi:hypothetical protein